VTNAPYEVRIAPAALRQIHTLPHKEQKILLKLIDALGINPRPPGVAKIEGLMGLYVERVNHHRLVYKVEEHEVLLLLVK